MPAPRRHLADGVHGAFVIGGIARRISGGQRGFAQHVIGIEEALRLPVARAVEGLGDGLAHHELRTHPPHRPLDDSPRQRGAASRHQRRHGPPPLPRDSCAALSRPRAASPQTAA